MRVVIENRSLHGFFNDSHFPLTSFSTFSSDMWIVWLHLESWTDHNPFLRGYARSLIMIFGENYEIQINGSFD